MSSFIGGTVGAVIGGAAIGGIGAALLGGGGDAGNAAAMQMSAEQLAFNKQQYADQKPAIDALSAQAIQSNALQQQTAQQQADRSATQWDNYSKTFVPINQQMGLNALGAQNLSPEDTARLAELQKQIGTPSGGLTPEETQQLQQLQGIQSGQVAAPAAGTASPAYRPTAGGGVKPMITNAPAAQIPWSPTIPNPNAGRPIWMGGGDAGGYGNDSEPATIPNPVPNPNLGAAAPGAAAPAAAPPTLTPEQLTQLNTLLAKQKTAQSASSTAAQQEIAALQKKAEANAIGLENAKAQKIIDTTGAQGKEVTAAYGANAAATKQGGADYATGAAANAQKYGDQVIGLGQENADQITANGQVISGDLNTMGDARRADQTGYYDKQAQELRDTAAQRGADFERKATTQTNADIETAAGDAQRQLLRLGGDPNKMAAMSGDIANQQQLARIASGNQVAKTNIANLNTADDQARTLQTTGFNAGTQQQYGLQDQALGVKSSALDKARESSTAAKQIALGMNAGAADAGLSAVTTANQGAADKTLQGQTVAQGLTFAGQNTATNIQNNAKDKVDANANALQQGAANFGAGFSNTSGQAAQTSIAASTAGVNNLNTGAQASVPMTNAINSGMNSAGNIVNTATANAIKADEGQASTFSGLAGMGASLIASSKKVKKNIRPIDENEALDGLASVQPKAWKYKAGEGDGKSHVGPMAEDMHKRFGSRVAPGGKAIDMISTLGLQHAAINALSKRVKQLEKRG